MSRSDAPRHGEPAVTDDELDDEAGRRAQVAALAASARRAGRAAVVSGRWLADTVVDVAPRLPVPVRGDMLGRAGRRQLRDMLRSRLARNLSALGPLLTGAAAAGYLNRRATLDVGRRVGRDFGLRV
jgi:hypothetical protein